MCSGVVIEKVLRVLPDWSENVIVCVSHTHLHYFFGITVWGHPESQKGALLVVFFNKILSRFLSMETIKGLQ
jgi:hypothetical protein